MDYCDKTTGEPEVNLLLAAVVTPLGATLATYFGAALGIAKRSAGIGRGQRRFPTLLRWGAAFAADDDYLALFQTVAAYVYFAGLIIAAYFLYGEADTHETLESPFTHIIIKTQGMALVGVIIGIVALALGVEPAQSDGDQGQ
jgi:hypothetical protein